MYAPTEALSTLRPAEGMVVELVASEPLIGDPVALAFDPDGRLWVLEMRGYMPDADGFGEDQGSGRLVVLTDDDRDGVMDRSTVFRDDLVLPRAFALVRGGALILEPPWLRRFYDDDKDLVADRDAILASGFGGLNNPEHAANGLVRGIDNWMQCINHPLRARDTGSVLVFDRSPVLGQWGGAFDDWGHLFHNSNSDVLRACLLPTDAPARHPKWPLSALAHHQVVKDQTVRPARPTPGVNRGYQPGFLDASDRLRTATGACSPWIYRGHLFPEDYLGNAFVCEPAGNLVKRYRLKEQDGRPTGSDAYTAGEWLASTDERFRPVAITEGPDGALYVADFYRGLIQHRLFLTSYLREQVERRELSAPTGLGRIWRLRPKDRPVDLRAPALTSLSSRALVELLDHRSGHLRDAAQRLLVERQDLAVVPALRELVLRTQAPALTRLHAAWTLEGLGAVTGDWVRTLSADPHPGLRSTAIRLAIRIQPCPLQSDMPRLLEDGAIEVRRMVALHLPDIFPLGQEAALAPAARKLSEDRELRDLFMTGVAQREAPLLSALLAEDSESAPPVPVGGLHSDLARSVMLRKDEVALSSVLDLLTAARADAPTLAVLQGLIAGRPAPNRKKFVTPWELSGVPPALAALKERATGPVAASLSELESRLTWPGKADYDDWAIPPLDARTRPLAERGAGLFGTTCAGCHHPEALGIEGLGPPLFESPRVQGPPRALIGITLLGLRGKLTVKGRGYDSEMPSLGNLDDESLASILTWLRREFGNRAGPILPEEVGALRSEVLGRTSPLEAEELSRFEAGKK